MTDCSRCQDRRTNPQLLCPLMLIDEFCHATGQQEDILRYHTRSLSPGWYQYIQGELVPYEPKPNRWPPRNVVLIGDRETGQKADPRAASDDPAGGSDL